jgi:hypothetical protein
MRRNTLSFVSITIVSLATSIPSAAQSSASVVNLGYQSPHLPQVAPGQVLYLTLHGLSTVFDSTQVAQTVPLPTNFNGLSISLQRSGTAQPELLPLLRGQGASSCEGSGPVVFAQGSALPCVAADYTYHLWVQIPFDLATNPPGSDNLGCPNLPCTNLNDAILTVMEASGPGTSLRVTPVVDQVHILNTCTGGGPLLAREISAYATYACTPAIAHADSSWVTADRPAKPGEELVAYAFGLGAPATLFPTASATPAGGVPLTQPFTISFTGVVTAPGAHPDYVGLVGGSAGLYQVNFHVPSVPANLAPCNSPSNFTQLPSNPSNLTITLLGTSSVDQASFCVQP